MQRTTLTELLDRYDDFLLDAYGVLVNSGGAIAGADAFLACLREAGKRFLILSNDASRSPETSYARYRGFGLPVKPEQIVTSGLLLAAHYASQGLEGTRTIVLGTTDSEEYVRQAGGVPVAPDDQDAEVVVVADDDGYEFLETVNAVVSVLLGRLDRGLPIHLVLPNPDVLFPLGPHRFGIASGAIAALIERVLRLRDPEGRHRFVPLGKPHRPIYEEAMARLPGARPERVVMVGDQIVTDIRGAADFGIDSVLVETGVGRAEDAARFGVEPTWILKDLKS